MGCIRKAPAVHQGGHQGCTKALLGVHQGYTKATPRGHKGHHTGAVGPALKVH